ncbi:MAG: hypothetical protein DRO93_14530 [Candidatus Thorarchaeota archaeon]|nr:MAG: hypothetical protein DRO93_14530 [Candidatus Thorarchaeota archaeon]
MVKIRGFSLIEIIIAVAIFAIVSVYMMRVLDQGHSCSRKLRMRTIAYFLAQEKMEELSTSSYAALFNTPNPDTTASCLAPCPLNCVVPPDECRTQVAGFSDFDREVDVTCPYLGFNNLAKVSVTVYWQGHKGERSFTLESMVANF